MVVSDRSYRRLTRLAALAVVSMALAFAAAVLPLPAYGGLILFAIASVPVYLAIGPYQADLAFNDALGEEERRWWRIALFLLPWTMTLYWRWYVRR